MRAKVQCRHFRKGCVASRAHVTDYQGVVHDDCRLWWCPDCGALSVNNGPWLEPQSATAERQVCELQQRQREARNAH
jgi:hypothetical protein